MKYQVAHQLVEFFLAFRKDPHAVVLRVERHGMLLVQIDQVLPLFAFRIQMLVAAVGHVVHLDAQLFARFLHLETGLLEQFLPRDVLGKEEIKENAHARQKIDDHEPGQRGGRALPLQENDGETQKKIDDEDRHDDRRRRVFIECDQSVKGSEHVVSLWAAA